MTDRQSKHAVSEACARKIVAFAIAGERVAAENGQKKISCLRGKDARDSDRERQYLNERHYVVLVCVCLHLHKSPSSGRIAKTLYLFTKVN